MEENKKRTHQRIVRKTYEGRAEKVDYSTSRSFDSEDRPRRSSSQGHGGQGHSGRNYGSQEHGSQSRSSQGRHGSASGRPAYGDSKPRKSGYGKPSHNNTGKPYGNTGMPYAKNSKPHAKHKPADEGMNAMLSRKPQVNGRYSDNDTAPTEIKEVVRLNKFIANSGVCSRREADTLIQSGVVTVNGEVVTELGTKVNILTDDIRFNGQRLKGEEKVYIVMNKPKGYVTTASDPHAEKTVMDLLKGCPTRVFPVGRLDKNTTGVLMFTNDGEMAERLTHPSYNKKKIYQVVLDAPLKEEDQQAILAGVELNDGVVAADELEYIDAHDHRQLGIEIHSGKNRVVRRIFESLGYEVRALDRVYFAGLTKKGLKKSDWRYLTEGEVNILKMGAYV